MRSSVERGGFILHVTPGEVDMLHEVLEWYRSDIEVFGVQHAESEDEAQEGIILVMSVEKLMRELPGLPEVKNASQT